jgi:hypothetical protein
MREKDVFSDSYGSRAGFDRDTPEATIKKMEGFRAEPITRADVAAAKELVDAEAKRVKAAEKQAAKEAAEAQAEANAETEARRQSVIEFLEGDLSGKVSDLRKSFEEAATVKTGEQGTVSSRIESIHPTGRIDPAPIEKKIGRSKTVLRAIESHQYPKDTRGALHGTHIDEYNGRKVAVASDGHRLIMVPYDGNQESGKTISRNPPKLAKTAGEYREIDGPYPNYKQVIPDRADMKAEVDITPEMIAQLRGAARVSQV